jgi:hypothetical protein
MGFFVYIGQVRIGQQACGPVLVSARNRFRERTFRR